MQNSETAELVWQPGMAIDLCPICQPRSSHAHKPDPGIFDGSIGAARPRLLRLAKLNGIAPDEAEDVVQETFLEAWRHLENLREPGRFSSWLDGICRNVCKRHLRTRMTSLQTSNLDMSEDEAEPSMLDLPDPFAIDPVKELERQDMQVLLDRALGHLSASTREVIELCYLAELPQREVAERLDMSLGALELKLHRARRQLHQVLHGELRTDAQAFGLLRDGDESMGWQETHRWCWGCGKRRLRATFEREPEGFTTFRLRCPDCSLLYDDDMMSTEQLRRVGALRSFHRAGTLRSFRPAIKRLLLDGMNFSHTVFTQRRCAICHSNVQIDLIDRNTLENMYTGSDAWPQSIYVQVTCPNCEPYVYEFFTVLLMNQDVHTFLLARSHVLSAPTMMDTSAGQEAFRSRLLDLRTGERLTIMTHPQTFQMTAKFLDA